MWYRTLGIVIVALVLTACGGSSGGVATPGTGGTPGDGGDSGGGVPPTTPPDLSVTPDPDFVGMFTALRSLTTDANALYVGDASDTEGYRTVVGFPLAALAAGAPPRSASLTVTLGSINGLPYRELGGQVVVDHIDLGAELDMVDSRAAALEQAFAVLSSDRTLGARTVDVTAQVQADLAAGRSRSDFRIYFPIPASRQGPDHQVLVNLYDARLEIRFGP